MVGREAGSVTGRVPQNLLAHWYVGFDLLALSELL